MQNETTSTSDALPTSLATEEEPSTNLLLKSKENSENLEDSVSNSHSPPKTNGDHHRNGDDVLNCSGEEAGNLIKESEAGSNGSTQNSETKNETLETNLSTDSEKSAFSTPAKVDDFMSPHTQPQQQQQLYQEQGCGSLDNDLLKFSGGNLSDFGFRNGGGHNNWGALEDINSINYGQPPPNPSMQAMLTASPQLPPQMANVRRSMSSGYPQQGQPFRQPQQQYPGQQNHFMMGRQGPGGPSYGQPSAMGWGQNSWSTGGMPTSPGPAVGSGWGNGGGRQPQQRMGGPGQMGMPQQRNRIFGSSLSYPHGAGNQYMNHQGRRRVGNYSAKADLMGNDDFSQVRIGLEQFRFDIELFVNWISGRTWTFG